MVADLFAEAGLTEDDAAFHAGALVQTNLWGVDSHGVLRVPIYIERLRSGVMNARPAIRPTEGDAGLEVLDGDNGPGFLVARAAMQRAIERAGDYNIAAVAATNSSHFGAAALYARMAADDGMIGIAMTNVIPNMVAPGGSKPITGNNPIAVAVPTYGDFPFVLDMSLSVVAGGKLLLASKKGETIPTTWATDADGRPTDDPDEAFAGFLLPVGGHKGLGLSYVVDILCGVITGGAFQHQLRSMYANPDAPSLTGHMMIVLNPGAIISRQAMQERMANFYETIKASPMWDDESEEMLLPGELEYRTEQERRERGIPLSPALYDELSVLGDELGISTALQKL